MKDLGVYIHIPFCIKRCNYCGFYSNAIIDSGFEGEKDKDGFPTLSPEIEEQYVSGILDKLERYGEELGRDRKIDTLYMGGGTPSLLTAVSVEQIIGACHDIFGLDENPEITIESNPGTIGEKKLKAFRNAGVNRLSIGVQSFDNGMLGMMGRIHNSSQAEEEFKAARNAGFDNVSIDLIFGVPRQTFDQWKDTLDMAFALEPEHISFYSLQIEEHTPFYEEYKEGKLGNLDPVLDRKMYHYALDKMRERGYHHYEISSAAKEGFECRHNLKYWTFQDYLGVGSSASSFVDGKRWTETPDEIFDNREDWMALQGELYHENDFLDNVGEYAFTALRTDKGIDKEDFKKRFGRDLWDVFSSAKQELKEYFDKGLLIEDDKCLKLSEYGIDVSNEIMAEFV